MDSGKELEDEVEKKANNNLKLTIKENENAKIEINNEFNKENVNLIENIEIFAEKNSRSDIVIKYKSKDNNEHYHNGILRVHAEKNSNINIIVINLLNTNANNFISIESELEEDSKLDYCIVDFGSKNSITNYYSNLVR